MKTSLFAIALMTMTGIASAQTASTDTKPAPNPGFTQDRATTEADHTTLKADRSATQADRSTLDATRGQKEANGIRPADRAAIESAIAARKAQESAVRTDKTNFGKLSRHG